MLHHISHLTVVKHGPEAINANNSFKPSSQLDLSAQFCGSADLSQDMVADACGVLTAFLERTSWIEVSACTPNAKVLWPS